MIPALKRAIPVAVAGLALYLVLPAITRTLAVWPRLSTLNPIWFAVAAGAEAASFACVFALQRLALGTKQWFAVVASGLAGPPPSAARRVAAAGQSPPPSRPWPSRPSGAGPCRPAWTAITGAKARRSSCSPDRQMSVLSATFHVFFTRIPKLFTHHSWTRLRSVAFRTVLVVGGYLRARRRDVPAATGIG